MTGSIGDNPLLLGGTLIVREGESAVVADGRGQTLALRWAEDGEARCEGTPANVEVTLPAGQPDGCLVHRLRFEARAVELRLAIASAGEFRTLSFTLCEDVRAEFIEATAPGMAGHDPDSGSRISTGPA